MKTVNITFDVRDIKKLRDEDVRFSVDDCVQAGYHYKGKFTCLDKLTKMIRLYFMDMFTGACGIILTLNFPKNQQKSFFVITLSSVCIFF